MSASPFSPLKFFTGRTSLPSFCKNLVTVVSQKAENSAVLLAMAMKDRIMDQFKALKDIHRRCGDPGVSSYTCSSAEPIRNWDTLLIWRTSYSQSGGTLSSSSSGSQNRYACLPQTFCWPLTPSMNGGRMWTTCWESYKSFSSWSKLFAYIWELKDWVMTLNV